LWDGVFAITGAAPFEAARFCFRPAVTRLARKRALIFRNDHDRQRYRDHDMALIEPSIAMVMGSRCRLDRFDGGRLQIGNAAERLDVHRR
jgi:hypothetical protein